VIEHALPNSHLINLGLIGASPQQYLRVYETYGRKLRPKLLLVGFFAGNDFWDAALFDRWLKTDRRCNYMVWRDFGRPSDCTHSWRWKAKLRLHRSYLYNLSFGLAASFRRQLRLETEWFQFADGSGLRLNVGDFESKARDGQPGRREFQLVLGALQEMHAAAENEGTKVLIVFQPSKEEVYLPLLRKKVLDPSQPLREELDKSGIEYLDLAPVFRERAAMGKKLFFEVDGHPNAAGQGLIADAVLAHLKNHPAKYDLEEFEASSPPAQLN
jgi:hypothetical protein